MSLVQKLLYSFNLNPNLNELILRNLYNFHKYSQLFANKYTILSGYSHQFCRSAWSFDSVSEEYAASIFRLHPHTSGVLFPLAWTKFCPLVLNRHTSLPSSFISTLKLEAEYFSEAWVPTD